MGLECGCMGKQLNLKFMKLLNPLLLLLIQLVEPPPTECFKMFARAALEQGAVPEKVSQHSGT
jgi:hypothetical protein